VAVLETRTSARAPAFAIPRPAVLLGAMVAISAVTRSIIAWHHSTARYFADEYLYQQLGRSIWHGHLMVRDHTAHFPALLEPLLAAPLWGNFSVETAYHLVQTENALFASLAAVPVYLLARRVGLGSGYALLCGLYAIVLPTLVMVVFTITDFVAYPLALAAILTGVRSLEKPSPRAQLAFIGFMALATAARTQYFVLAPAYLLGALLMDGKGAIHRHKTALLAFAPAVAAVLVAATGYFSTWFHNIPFGWRDLSQPALQIFLLSMVVGVVLAPGAVVGLWRPTDRETKAFAYMAGTFAVMLIGAISIFSANTVRFKERYLFPVLPLLAIGFGIYRKRGYPHPWAVFLMSVGLAIAAARLPVSAYATGAGRFDSESLTALEWLQGSVGVASTSILAAAIITVGAVWATITALTRRGALSLPLAIVLAIATTVVATHEDFQTTNEVRRHFLPADAQWIAHATAHRPVTAIATPLSSSSSLLLQLYWNPNVDRVVLLDDASPPDIYATEQLGIANNGTLQNAGKLFYFDTDGSFATFSGAQRVATTSAGSVWRAVGRPRFRILVEGMQRDGWLIAGGRLRAWPKPTAPPGARSRLAFTASVPQDWPGIAVLRIGSGKWYLHPGKPVRIACTSGSGEFDAIYRSPSTILDDQGRAVSVRLTHIAASDLPKSARPRPTTCIRTNKP